MPNKILVHNPYLNEFVYDLLYNITPEQKKNLSKQFLSILKSNVKSKNFSDFSSLDEKVRFFSELGIESAIVFFQDKFNSVNALKKILEKYDDNKQAGASKEMTSLKIFVSSDKQVKFLLGMMSDTIMHRSYFLNQDFNKIGFHVKEWSKKLDSPASTEIKDAIENSDIISKTILNSCMSIKFVDGFIGIDEHSILVLLYLSGYRHTYVDKEFIWEYFVGVIPKGKVTTCIKRLFLDELIRKHVDYSNPRYTITSSGIEKVNQFRNRVIKQNNF